MAFPVRSSGRRISLSAKNIGAIKFIEGHGELIQPETTFVVPDSVEIVIYQGKGVGLSDIHGQAIADGKGVPSRLPTKFDAINQEYDTHASGGAVRANTQGTKIYRGGERCPNYVLYAADEPGFDKITVQQTSILAKAGQPTTLETIADLQKKSPQSVQLHWAACTVLR